MDLQNADCILIEGSNFAECHPVGFRWVMMAKERGATLIHVDPRFTRTSAMADVHVPIRAGTDIAFLGGLINWMIQNERYFKEYVVAYTNASTIINDEFQDSEDLGGVFSGLDRERRTYNPASWRYRRGPLQGELGRAGDPFKAEATWNEVLLSQAAGPVDRDETLQDPRTVFQILKRHYARYTPEMVEQISGVPRDLFVKVAETLANNSGRERTSAIAYAVGWTQHTYGPQMISTAALLQLLLGNIGRPGGGVMALRGHATIQGSTDIPTLYHSIHGYMSAPSALRPHDTLLDYLKIETPTTSWWANTPKYMISYLKSMYGAAATADNEYGYAWHPKISGDHSHMPMMVAMADGLVKGMFVMGQNPATSINGSLERKALAKLDWMVVRDLFETETASFWYTSPEVKSGEMRPENIQTEVFFLPAAHVAEMDGSFTNTQRLVQWHDKAVDPPDDARSDVWFTVHLGNRLKGLYASSTLPRDQGFKNLLWDFMPDRPETGTRIADEPDVLKILREINGYEVATGKHVDGFANLKDDGTTAGASWIYCGIYPEPGRNRAASRQADEYVSLNWGYSWPANRRILYNRASAAPDGQPWSERKKYVWWDAGENRWTGLDVPDFAVGKAPNTPAQPEGVGLDAHSGADPFIMKADGRGWLFAPTGLVDGPLPTYYEPAESPTRNALYPQQTDSPVFKYWDRPDNRLARPEDPNYPIVITTYRLTEHHLSGAMSRWLPWLSELQPELFVELSPELAREKGIANLDWVTVRTPRGACDAKALVTKRLRPLTINGKMVHQIGMPWHWGYMGVVTGDVANNLTALVGDPNVTIHSAKAFVCNLERSRKA